MLKLILFAAFTPFLLLAQDVPAGETASSDAVLEDANETEQQRRTVLAQLSEVPSEALLEAVREFRAQTSALGDVVEATASGNGGGLRGQGQQPTHALHGRVFDNFRNDALDAIPHQIVQRNQPQRKLRRNQYGLNVTGPVYLPKIYDGANKTFFTFQFEGVREAIGQTDLNTIPTTRERTGSWSHVVDFVGNPLPIYDPMTTFENPNYNPALPVSPDNLQYDRVQFPGNQIPITRLDPVAQEALRYYPQPNANAGPFFRNNYFVVSNEVNRSDGFTATVDHTFLTKNRVTVRVNRSVGVNGSAPIFPTIANPNNPPTDTSSRSLRLEHIYTASATTINTLTLNAQSNQFDRTAPLGPNGAPFPRYDIDGYQNMGVNQPYLNNTFHGYQLSDSFAIRLPQHRLTFTLNLSHNQDNTYQPNSPEGRFRFTSGLTSLPGVNNTGHAFASFLLGGSSFTERGVVTSRNYFRLNGRNFQVNDQWQVFPSLTLTLGANLDISTPRYEKFDRYSNISLDVINPANNHYGALVVANRDGFSRGFQQAFVKVQPSIGIAWSVLGDNDTVLRMNYGRFYGGYGSNSGHQNTQAFNGRQTWLSDNQQLYAATILREGLLGGAHFPDLRPQAANGTEADFLDVSDRQPTQHFVNIELQRQLAPFLILTVRYNHQNGRNQRVGNNGANPNAIPLDALVYEDRLNNLEFANSLRPYPQYQDFNVNGFPIGKQKTNSFRARLEKRTSGGFAMSVEYRFEKRYDNASQNVQNYYNLNEEWSLSSFNRLHSLQFDYIYELPFGPGRRWLTSNGPLGQVFGGWALTGTGEINGGQPLTLRAQFNNTAGVVNNLRADIVPGVDPHVKNPGPELWFNPDAFAQPEDFRAGNSPRTHPTLRGPGNWNTDLTASKRFPLPYNQTLEFTASMFNVLNHANWNNPDTRIGTNINAGRIIGSSGGRIVQLGLRLNF